MTLLAQPALAEGWTHNDVGNYWTYEKSDGTGARNEWLWIDRNNDRLAECYYFDADGKMLTSTTTPDGYKVNENGEWVSEGSVMKCVVAKSEEQAAQADRIAKNVANAIMNDSTKQTDLDRVRAAAQFTELCCGASCYGADDAKHYRSPYGVFISGIYTCSGSTRALGRILDYRRIAWEHANENQDTHQWCIKRISLLMRMTAGKKSRCVPAAIRTETFRSL